MQPERKHKNLEGVLDEMSKAVQASCRADIQLPVALPRTPGHNRARVLRFEKSTHTCMCFQLQLCLTPPQQNSRGYASRSTYCFGWRQSKLHTMSAGGGSNYLYANNPPLQCFNGLPGCPPLDPPVNSSSACCLHFHLLSCSSSMFNF
eukprot:2361260-Rhodomonas_salina.4